MDKFSVKINSTEEMIAARKLFQQAGFKLYHLFANAYSMGGHSHLVYDKVDVCRSHHDYGTIHLEGVEQLRAHLVKAGKLKGERLENFAVDVKTDEDFVNLIAFLKEQGYPIFHGTLRATGMEQYSMVGWNSDEVCRVTSIGGRTHYTSIAAFMRDVLDPEGAEARAEAAAKAAKREALLSKVGEARSAEHAAQLKASAATAARVKLEQELKAL